MPGEGGSSSITRRNSSTGGESPEGNAGRPASSSYNSSPKEYTSLAVETAPPCNCSGLA